MCLVLLELKKRCSAGTSASSRSLSRLALPVPRFIPSPFPSHLLSCCLSLPILPSLCPSVSPFISYISCPCSVGSHAVLCEASNQHQQQDQADPESSRSKATQQREIDGLCSQMRSASLHIVCVRARVFVICRMEGWM